ncbi:site-specific integrase [Cryobacterium sp. TMT2-4]|nr:site-specific integrase [Cryobacterium sp. TMT2-4]
MSVALGRVTHLPLRPEATSPDAVFTEMVDSWRRQQLSRNFRHETISGREQTIRRFADFTGHFPWEWTFADVEDYFAYTRSVSNLSQATVRAYQTNLKLFCDFLTDPAYDWSEVCGRSFGRPVTQIITDFNRATHTQQNEQRATKRPFSRRELQDFFDLADVEVERVINSGRKGAIAAYRDAIAFKTAYAWGLRANEVTHLQLVDFSRNPHSPQFGDFGVLHVRYGKAQKGYAPKRRSVLTVFEWSPEAVHRWIRTGLPHLAAQPTDLFPTSQGLVVPKSNLRRRFRAYVNELGFPAGLDMHSLRRSYVTHLFEFYGFEHTFVQQQVGHLHSSTTSIYTAVSSDYQTRALNRVLERTINATTNSTPWEEKS